MMNTMNAWQVQDAKARFSEFLDACITQGPQLVTRRGTETAMLITVAEYQRLCALARPSLKALLLSDENRGDLLIPERGAAQRRAAVAL